MDASRMRQRLKNTVMENFLAQNHIHLTTAVIAYQERQKRHPSLKFNSRG